jgi:CDP-6-deoxy-D-xylo-4-hexulose-3-dehydrase
MLGSFGDISTFSFYPAHQITTGEGGAAATSDDQLAGIMLSLRSWGRDCICEPGQDNACGHRFSQQWGNLPFGYDHKYVYANFGYNLKMTEMQGAIGTIQLSRISEFKRKRTANWTYLRTMLDELEEYFILPEAESNSDPCWFGFMLSCKDRVERRQFQISLEEAGIQTRLLFAGNITKQPCFQPLTRDVDYRICGALGNTDYVMNNGIWIGVYPGLSIDQIQYMVNRIKQIV